MKNRRKGGEALIRLAEPPDIENISEALRAATRSFEHEHRSTGRFLGISFSYSLLFLC